jgi:hypothetical protein
MNFRTIKAAIVSVLGAGAAGKYRVIGYQEESMAAEESIDTLRSVQVFYSDGDFPKSSGGLSWDVMHDITFSLRLTVAKAAKVDLAVLQNPSSTQLQYATALAALQKAGSLADDSMDEMIDDIYQTIMDARQIDLGLAVDAVTDRWIESARKNDPIPRGQYAVITGSMELTCSSDEEVLGDTGTPITEMEAENPIKDDPTGKFGVKVTIP